MDETTGGTAVPAPADVSAAGAAETSDGQQTLVPGHRFVALYGHPGISGLGALGQQDVQAGIERVKEVAAEYEQLSDVPVMPTFEIIATIADKSPGDDGNDSAELDPAELRPWIDAAGDAGIYVLLDLQPGRSDFLSQAKLYADLLREPHVGLALDPEWRLKPSQVHLAQVGGVDAAEVNEVITWLADLTADNQLPQKLFLLHQFRLSMLRDQADIDTSRSELAMVIQMDGLGTPGLKDETWAVVRDATPEGFSLGWKNFYKADNPTMTPAETMAKEPTPVLISYE